MRNANLLDHRCGSVGTTVSSGNKRSQENRRLEQEALALQAKNKSYALLESDDEGAGQLQVRPSKHKKSKKEKKSKREKHRYLTLPLHCKKPFKGPRLGIYLLGGTEKLEVSPMSTPHSTTETPLRLLVEM